MSTAFVVDIRNRSARYSTLASSVTILGLIAIHSAFTSFNGDVLDYITEPRRALPFLFSDYSRPSPLSALGLAELCVCKLVVSESIFFPAISTLPKQTAPSPFFLIVPVVAGNDRTRVTQWPSLRFSASQYLWTPNIAKISHYISVV